VILLFRASQLGGRREDQNVHPCEGGMTLVFPDARTWSCSCAVHWCRWTSTMHPCSGVTSPRF
jgi:hypothetical protein